MDRYIRVTMLSGDRIIVPIPKTVFEEREGKVLVIPPFRTSFYIKENLDYIVDRLVQFTMIV